MRTLKGGLSLAIAVSAVAAIWAATRIPADDTFRDNATDMIRSDGNGPYRDGFDCVVSWVQTNEFFMRTVKPSCTPVTARGITIDFTNLVPGSGPSSCSAAAADGTLNTCGSNLVADVRVIASSMFANSALANGSSVVLPFSMQPNFSGTDFELDFEQNVPVAADTSSSSIRHLTAQPSAIAELYQYVPSKNGRSSVKVSLGRYYMPFSLAVKKVQ